MVKGIMGIGKMQSTVNVLNFRTPKFPANWHVQTVQIQIRLLPKDQSDQGLHRLPFY